MRCGTVERDGIELHDGRTAGVGDQIVSRRNDRRLTTRDGRHFVKNGDLWTIRRRQRSGDLSLKRSPIAHSRKEQAIC